MHFFVMQALWCSRLPLVTGQRLSRIVPRVRGTRWSTVHRMHRIDFLSGIFNFLRDLDFRSTHLAHVAVVVFLDDE